MPPSWRPRSIATSTSSPLSDKPMAWLLGRNLTGARAWPFLFRTVLLSGGPMDHLKLAIAGAAGRMGRTLTRVARETPGIVVAGGLEPPQSPVIGADMGELAGIGPIGIAVTADAPSLFAVIDAIVDFTTPAASME